jgi:HPt (histidine-containing phosphotransfer) domain-containing protein
VCSSDLLKVFLDSTTSTVSKLQLAASTGDHAGMLAAAHSLKGSCGGIGASMLQHSAKELEEALRTHATDARIRELARKVPVIWDLTQTACQHYLQASRETETGHEISGLANKEIEAALETLRTQLKGDDTESLDTIEQILDQPMNSVMRANLSNLARYVTRYQFDIALQQLDKLLTEHHASEE